MAEQKITEDELTEMRSNFRHTDRIIRLVDAYRAQAAEIAGHKARFLRYVDKLSAKDAEIDLLQLEAAKGRMVLAEQSEEITQLKARGVTEKEAWEQIAGYFHPGAARTEAHRKLCDLLRAKGLLIEDTPEKIYGVEVPKDLPEYTVKVSEEDDPLKVDMNTGGVWSKHEILLAQKHNALVDDVKADYDCLEGQIMAHAKMLREIGEELEAKLNEPTNPDQTVWPKMPITLLPIIREEFARIRARLGVKEAG